MGGVIEQLVLGRTPVDVIVLLCAPIKHSGVSTRRNHPVERQLEITILIRGDEVADRTVFRQSPIDNPPPRRNGLRLVTAPARQRRAVEQRLPTRRALRGG